MRYDGPERDAKHAEGSSEDRRVRRRPPRPSLSYTARVVEERIIAAQKAGAFDSLSGKGKPLELEDLRQVPEDLRIAYHVLKNAGMLPPELELKKDVLSLRDLLAVTGEEPKRHAIIKEMQEKLIHMDILHRRSFGRKTVGFYGKKLIDKLGRR